ncbi:hypothetical protein PENTCL1PPCAC_5350, partial [Pristionchus entomophagus]
LRSRGAPSRPVQLRKSRRAQANVHGSLHRCGRSSVGACHLSPGTRTQRSRSVIIFDLFSSSSPQYHLAVTIWMVSRGQE